MEFHSLSIFRFLSTCDTEKRIWISFFVFAALWKGDLNFGFCFSFSHHFEKRIWISFFVFHFRITWKTDFNFIFRICVACYWKTDWSFLNECTLVPTVFRWHKEMEFKFHFYFSFFFGLVKWNSIPFLFFVFCLLVTLKNGFEFRFSFSPHFEKGIWISVFVFRFLITLKNGFEFRFLCSIFASLGKRISISFFVFALLVIEKQIGVFCMNLKSGLIHQSFETPPPLPLRRWPG